MANRIDQTPARISTNLSVDRQTPKADVGDRFKAGLDTAAGVLASGVAMAAPMVPGGSILSAAVSSLSTLSHGGSMGSTGGAMSGSYAATGVVQLGGGSVNTTVGSAGPGVGGLGGTGTTAGGNFPGAASVVGNTLQGAGNMLGMANSGLSDQASQLGSMLQVQMQIQRENQVFTTVSNVLKTRHDTVKNTISNVR